MTELRNLKNVNIGSCKLLFWKLLNNKISIFCCSRYAALAHYKLVHIHPFSDGNGRTSRLLMNMILMQAGYPPVIIHKRHRHEYYENLQIANGGDVRPFVRFIAECTEQTLDLFLWATSEFSKQVPALSQDTFSRDRQSTIILNDDDTSDFENDWDECKLGFNSIIYIHESQECKRDISEMNSEISQKKYFQVGNVCRAL